MWLVVFIDAHASVLPAAYHLRAFTFSITQLATASVKIEFLTHFCDVTNVQNCLMIECLNIHSTIRMHTFFHHVFTFIRGHNILLNYVLLKIKIVRINLMETNINVGTLFVI